MSQTKQYDFWNGPDTTDRRITYAKAFTPEIQANGDNTQRLIGALLVHFKAETQVDLPGGYASGWRPPAVNEHTANAAAHSAHLDGLAGDVRDTEDGDLAWWCMRNLGALEQHGLYMEHPCATVVRAWETAKANKRPPTPWCHLSPRAPGAHIRCYWPDSRSIAEWDAFTRAGGANGTTYAAWLLFGKNIVPSTPTKGQTLVA